MQNEGINVRKMSPNTLMIVNLISPNGKYDDLRLSNYATVNVKDELGRLPGVAGITYLGQRDYSLRVWLDADKMAAVNLERHGRGRGHQPAKRANCRRTNRPAARPQGPAIPVDHQHAGAAHRPGAVRRHHPQVRSEQHLQGRFHGSASAAGQAVPPARAASASPVTGIVRLRDVARVEQGSQQYDQSCTLDGKPSVALSIYQLPGSNALETAAGVYAKMKDLKTRFPEGSGL